MCGAEIEKDDWYMPMKFAASFGLYNALYDASIPNRCGHCSAILENSNFLFELGTGVYSAEGFVPFQRKVHRAWGLNNLPGSPYIVTIQVNRSQHTVWRAPVNYSKDLVSIRLGEEVATLRMPILALAAEQSRKAQHLWLSLQPENRQKSTAKLPPPLGFSPLDGSGIGIGEMQRWLIKLIDEGHIEEKDVAALGQLTNSESWALDFMLAEEEEPPMTTQLDDHLAGMAAKKKAAKG